MRRNLHPRPENSMLPLKLKGEGGFMPGGLVGFLCQLLSFGGLSKRKIEVKDKEDAMIHRFIACNSRRCGCNIYSFK